jgi:hypothetical protein
MLRFIITILSLILSSVAVAEQFSIKCAREEWHYVTFDTETNRVIYESPSGLALKGRIITASRNEIAFDLIKIGSPKFDLTWRPDETGDGTLTWIGLPNNPERQTVIVKCSGAALRPILSFYEQIAPTQ